MKPKLTGVAIHAGGTKILDICPDGRSSKLCQLVSPPFAGQIVWQGSKLAANAVMDVRSTPTQTVRDRCRPRALR